MKPSIRNIVRDAIRALRIEDGDVIVIRGDSNLAEERNFRAIAELIGNSGRKRCICVVANTFEDIKALDENVMREHGWARLAEEEE